MTIRPKFKVIKYIERLHPDPVDVTVITVVEVLLGSVIVVASVLNVEEIGIVVKLTLLGITIVGSSLLTTLHVTYSILLSKTFSLKVIEKFMILQSSTHVSVTL